MVRTPCCRKEGVKRGAWTEEDDQKLVAYVTEHGEGGWRTLPEKAGLKRCGKSCRLRWTNYLKPDIKRGVFSREEEETIISLHASRGNKWSAIARSLPGRTDNEIKNYWNTKIKKRLIEKGIDPITHKNTSEEKPNGLTSGSEETRDFEEICGFESETNKENEIEQQKPVSGSVMLLNKVANRFGLKVTQSVLTQIIEGSGSEIKNSNNESNTHSPTISSASFASLETTMDSGSRSTKIQTFQTDFENNFHSEVPFPELSQPESGDREFENMSLESWILSDHPWQDCSFELTDFMDISNEWTDGFLKDLRDSCVDEQLETE